MVTEPTLDDAADYRFDNLYRVNWIEKLPDYQYQCLHLPFYQICDTFATKKCNNEKIVKMELFNVYSLYPVEPVRGKSCFVYDAAGTEYLDLYGGHAVISIGHAQPDYVRALSEQAARLGFYSNSVENSLQTTLAEKLGRASGYDDYSLFLCNSGAEANENALKLASFHTGRTKVLAFSKAFHGRTSGAVAATDTPAISAPFNRTANVEFVPLNDLAAARAKLATGEFAAVIIEGIQGVAGIHCPADDFLRGLRTAASKPARSLSSTRYSRATDARVASSPTRQPASAPT